MKIINLCDLTHTEVIVQTETEILPMVFDASEWTCKNEQIRVSFKMCEDELTWFLSSKTERIIRVVIRWKHENQGEVSILGDHWERGYGDLEWRGVVAERVMPWYFMVKGNDETNLTKRTDGYGVKTNPNVLCFWQYTEEDVTLIMDTRCLGRGVWLENKILEMATVVYRKGRENETSFLSTKEFCKQMCLKSVLPREPVFGGNNWYYAYGNSSAEEIIRDAKQIEKWSRGLKNRPFMVIDACWQQVLYKGISCAGGPYEKGNERFPDMKELADKMKKIGVRPGIWCRPLVTSAKVKSDWVLREIDEGVVLDPTIPEVIDMIGKDIARMNEWGYDLIKYDFTTYDILGQWGFEMGHQITKETKSFSDPSVTTAQVLKNLYSVIYQNAGDSYLLGCNTIGHLSTGLVHIHRTGDDTSGLEWERTRKMGINTLGFRMPQHNVFFACDADCVGLTKQIPLELNKQWLDLLSKSGTPLFVSVDPEVVDEGLDDCLAQSFRIASRQRDHSVPCDWEMTTTPREWIWYDDNEKSVCRYAWNDQSSIRIS